MQNFNFFQWLRDGVKQSVLQGVSDAVETIGAPDQDAQLHPSIAALANNKGQKPLKLTAAAAGSATPAASSAGGRKRLGRSLKDIETPLK